MFNKTLQYLRPYRRQWTLHLLLAIAVSALQLLAPWPMKIIVDSIVGDIPLPSIVVKSTPAFFSQDKPRLLLAVVFFSVLLAVVISALKLWSTRISIEARQSIVLQLKSDLFFALQHQSFRYHQRRPLGDLIYRINNDVWGIDELILTMVPLIVTAVTLIGMFSILFYLNWQMALISLFVLPIFYYTYVFYSTHFGERVDEVQRLEGEVMSIGQEVLSALPVVKAFTREQDEHARFVNRGRAARDARVQLTTQQTTYSLAVGLITTTATSLVLGFGAYLILQGRLTVGELLVVLAYLAAVYTPLESIHSAFTYMHAYAAKLKRVFEVLDAEPDIRDRPGARVLEGVQGRVTFENVEFAHVSSRPTLSNITLEVLPGQVVGIVGATGAGKTTLASMIPRFYDPDAGRVLVDGNDLREVQIKSLRKHVSIVLQDAILLSGTIRENIRYGRPDSTVEEIVAAARAANAHDFILQKPEGYDSLVGERGVNLSGGERQRIAIARAFLKDAPILLLDEPTSSVDYKTEALILEALQRLMDGRTTFIIAHRLSTIAQADKIVVLQMGRIVEIGTHAELLAVGGVYCDLYRRSAGGTHHAAPTTMKVPS